MDLTLTFIWTFPECRAFHFENAEALKTAPRPQHQTTFFESARLEQRVFIALIAIPIVIAFFSVIARFGASPATFIINCIVLLPLAWTWTSSRQYWLRVRDNWLNTPVLQFPVTYRLTDTQFTYARENLRMEIDWPDFIHAHETQASILLVTAQRQVITIPKRAFRSPTDLNTFRTFLQSRFPRHSHAFPIQPSP